MCFEILVLIIDVLIYQAEIMTIIMIKKIQDLSTVCPVHRLGAIYSLFYFINVHLNCIMLLVLTIHASFNCGCDILVF